MTQSSLAVAMISLAAGAVVFTGVGWLINVKWGSDSGKGRLAAITLDGIHENLASDRRGVYWRIKRIII